MSTGIITTTSHSVPGKAVELTGLASVIDALVEAKEKAKLYDQLCDDLEATVKARLGDAEIGTLDGQPVVSYKSAPRQALSQRKLKEEYPAVASACLSYGMVRTFRMLD